MLSEIKQEDSKGLLGKKRQDMPFVLNAKVPIV